MPTVPEPCSGPAGTIAAGFLTELARKGYARWSARSYLAVMRHLSRWLSEHEWSVAELTPQRLACYVEDRRVRGYAKGRSIHGMVGVVVGYLREIGAAPEARTAPETSLERLVEEFLRYLIEERGLAPRTIPWYRFVAQSFLATCSVGEDPIPKSLLGVNAQSLNAFMLAESKHRGRGSMKNLAVALRALMRFLYLHGHTRASLGGAVLSGPGWRDPGISRALQEGQVAQLLASCDRRTVSGVRDFAVLTVLARLGLRASEAAALMLEDVDWRNGTILVHGKGNRHDKLPPEFDSFAAPFAEALLPQGAPRLCQIVQRARRKTLQTTTCSASRPPNLLGLAMRPRNVHNGPDRFVPNESKSGLCPWTSAKLWFITVSTPVLGVTAADCSSSCARRTVS